jgi:hypothetical protein
MASPGNTRKPGGKAPGQSRVNDTACVVMRRAAALGLAERLERFLLQPTECRLRVEAAARPLAVKAHQVRGPALAIGASRTLRVAPARVCLTLNF